MTHEIEIIISHFSRPLKSLSVIFMAHGIYNTPTFHGSWTLVPDISWQFHEPWKPLSTFHRKFMAWKIGHENEISVFRALKNAFLGFKWHFHGIFITLQFIVRDRGRRPRWWITPSEIYRILHILLKSIIVLLYIQNNFKFKNKLKRGYLGKC